MSSKSFEAKELYNTKMYDAVINLYKDTGEGYEFDKWDYYYYSSSLRKKEMYKEALKTSSEGMKKYPDFSNIKEAYCWSIYYIYVREFNPETGNEQEFLKAVDTVINFSKQDKYSPFVRTIWKVADYYNSKINAPYDRIDHYISLLNAELLSDEPNKVLADGREREIESNMEKWYSLKGKALLTLGRYEECIKISTEAMTKLKVFHHNNNVWFQYREAICYLELNRLDKAEEIILKQLQYLEHWSLNDVLFTIYRRKNDFDKALKYASMAALSNGEHKHKVQLYEGIADFLKENGMQKEGYCHLLLVKTVREENGWKLSSTLLDKLEGYKEEEVDKKTLVRLLEKFWRENKLRGEKIFKGEVSNILPNGKAGFIKDMEGSSFYFRMSSIRGRNVKVVRGTKVSFYIKKSFDKVKGAVSNEAIEISIDE
jgi:tetratricopeptide (TPR) repeat protein